MIEFSLSTAWDIRTTGSAIQYSFGEDFNPKSILFKPDGTKLYIVGSNTDCIYEKTLTSPWDLTTTGSAVSYSLATSTLTSMTVSEDGKRLLITRSQQIDYYTFKKQLTTLVQMDIMMIKKLLRINNKNKINGGFPLRQQFLLVHRLRFTTTGRIGIKDNVA